jgi:hypothetical protein
VGKPLSLDPISVTSTIRPSLDSQPESNPIPPSKEGVRWSHAPLTRLIRLGALSLPLACVLAGPGIGNAGPLIGGTGPWGSFTAELNYSFTSSTAASLTVDLTNTSPLANGGYITAFVFNNPADKIDTVALTTTDADFGLLGGPTFADSINGAPYGQFDIGASTGGGFDGGGNPHLGMPAGGSALFTFNFTGTGLNTLSVADFLATLSEGTGAGQGYKSFVVRFRGFENDQGDMVPGHAPEPTALLLGGLGSLGILGYRCRRR